MGDKTARVEPTCKRYPSRTGMGFLSFARVSIEDRTRRLQYNCASTPRNWRSRFRCLDSYRFIRKQEYFNKFMQLVGVGGCFGWSGRLYGRPIRVCCWAVVLQRVDGERGCWRGARRVVCERE